MQSILLLFSFHIASSTPETFITRRERRTPSVPKCQCCITPGIRYGIPPFLFQAFSKEIAGCWLLRAVPLYVRFLSPDIFFRQSRENLFFLYIASFSPWNNDRPSLPVNRSRRRRKKHPKMPREEEHASGLVVDGEKRKGPFRVCENGKGTTVGKRGTFFLAWG